MNFSPSNNSRKITQITSILKLRKENVDKNLKGEDINNENLAERLNNIAQTLAVLTRALKQQLITQKRSADVNKQNINEQKKKNREKDLEKQKEKQSGGGGAGRVVNAIKAPFTGIFDAAKKFFGNIVAGSAVLGLMKWLKEMEDSKWQSMIKTLQDNAGLVLSELEVTASDYSFVKPEWLGEDVTKDERFGNVSLARDPWCDWVDEM